MRTTDMQSLGEVAAEGLTVLNALVRGVHTGIAGRVFSSLGPAAKPVAVVHDAIAEAVYGAVGSAGRRLPAALSRPAAEGLAFDDDTPLDERPRIAAAIAALNGIYGDELAERGNTFAAPMSVRVLGRPVPLTHNDVAATFPGHPTRWRSSSTASARRSRPGAGRPA